MRRAQKTVKSVCIGQADYENHMCTRDKSYIYIDLAKIVGWVSTLDPKPAKKFEYT